MILQLAAGAVVGAGLPAFADDATKTPVDVDALLFDAKHFLKTPQTAKITYAFKRVSQKPDLTQPSFTDEIDLSLEPGDRSDSRNIVVTLFKGPNHRPAGPFDGISFNPVVILTLEYHLLEISKVLKANTRYLKNEIRAAMRDTAISEAITVPLGGKQVPATRITIKPFERDEKEKQRLGVFRGAIYQFTVAPDVPGSIYEIQFTVPGDTPTGPAFFEEDLRYAES